MRSNNQLNKQFQMIRFYRPKMILNVIAIAALAQTAIGAVIVIITLSVPTKPWLWDVGIPLAVLVYLWIAWSLALAGVWVTEKRIVVVQPFRVRVLSRAGVHEVGWQKRWGGIIATAYIRWDAQRTWILGISSPSPTDYPGLERRARATVEHLRQVLGLSGADDHRMS